MNRNYILATRILVPTLISLCCSAPIDAAVVTLADFSGSATLIDFDSLDPGTVTGGSVGLRDGDVITSQFSADGVVFSNPNPSLSIYAEDLASLVVSMPNSAFVDFGSTESSGLTPIELQFSAPVNRVGFDLPGLSAFVALTMELQDSAGTTLETVTTDSRGFVGLESSSLVAKVLISAVQTTNGTSANFFMDNVRFEAVAVPEPSPLMLIGAVGLLGVATRRRS